MTSTFRDSVGEFGRHCLNHKTRDLDVEDLKFGRPNSRIKPNSGCVKITTRRPSIWNVEVELVSVTFRDWSRSFRDTTRLRILMVTLEDYTMETWRRNLSNVVQTYFKQAELSKLNRVLDESKLQREDQALETLRLNLCRSHLGIDRGHHKTEDFDGHTHGNLKTKSK